MEEKNRSNIKNKQQFAERFRKIRKDKGLSQKEISSMLGLTGNTQVSKFEQGLSEPSLESLRELITHIGVDLHWLITGQPAPAVNQLKPFADAHLSEIRQKIQNLEKERSDLLIRQSMGEIHISRLHEITEELDSLTQYHKVVSKHINDLIGYLNEKI